MTVRISSVSPLPTSDVQLADGRRDILCDDEDRIDSLMREIERGPGTEAYRQRQFNVHVMWSF